MSYIRQSDLGAITMAPQIGLSGAIAAVDAKASASQQLATLESNYAKGAISHQAAYVQAQVIAKDVSQYDPWSSSWVPLSAGGYYSSDDILSRARALVSRIVSAHPDVATQRGTQRSIEIAPAPVIEPGTCKEKAYAKWGRIVGDAPGMDVLTCYPWLPYAVGGVAVAGVGLFYFGGFIKAAGHIADRMSRKD